MSIGSGPFANVSVSQVNSNTVRVQINALSSGSEHFLFRTFAMNLASGVSVVNNPTSSFNWTVGNGTPYNPQFITGPDRPRDGFSTLKRFNSLFYSGIIGPDGFSQMSFDLTGIDVVGDGSNFFQPNSRGLFLMMHVISFGDAGYTDWRGNGIAFNGPNTPVAAPAPPAIVLLASGAFTALGGFVFRRRRAA